MRLTKEELQLPEAQGVRLVALSLLDDVSAPANRLASSRNSKDLHDFRVALRKLRSWLRAFQEGLPRLGKSNLRRLKTCAEATNTKRDQDVQGQWLAREARGPSSSRRRGARWLISHFDGRVEAVRKTKDVDIPRDLEKVVESLSSRLSTYRHAVRVSENRGLSLAQAISARLMPHTLLLMEALDDIETVADRRRCHEARIAAKRLRYLLEPAAPCVRGGQATVEKLRALQNALGSVHDLQILMLRVEETLQRTVASESAESPARPTDILAIEKRLEGDADRSFKPVRDGWLDGRAAKFGGQMERVARRLMDQMTLGRGGMQKS
jgi:CHAD domain-containing protein